MRVVEQTSIAPLDQLDQQTQEEFEGLNTARLALLQMSRKVAFFTGLGYTSEQVAELRRVEGEGLSDDPEGSPWYIANFGNMGLARVHSGGSMGIQRVWVREGTIGFIYPGSAKGFIGDHASLVSLLYHKTPGSELAVSNDSITFGSQTARARTLTLSEPIIHMDYLERPVRDGIRTKNLGTWVDGPVVIVGGFVFGSTFQKR